MFAGAWRFSLGQETATASSKFNFSTNEYIYHWTNDNINYSRRHFEQKKFVIYLLDIMVSDYPIGNGKITIST